MRGGRRPGAGHPRVGGRGVKTVVLGPVRVPDSLAERIDYAADELGVTRSDIQRQALEEWLHRRRLMLETPQ